MKTNAKALSALILMPLMLLTVNCNKNSGSSSSGNSTTYYVSNGACYASGTVNQTAMSNCGSYYFQSGNCYSAQTLQPVFPSSLCSSERAFYSLSFGDCYAASNGQPVNPSNCAGGATGFGINGAIGGVNGTTMLCQGTYFSGPTGQQQVICNGFNCSGLTVFQQNGTPIFCQ